MKTITVLLAEDHMIVREGLRVLLGQSAGITVIGEAQQGRAAVAFAKKHRPAVVVMDIAMPLLNGLSATQQILKALPETKIVILSAHSDDPYIEKALEAGASGFLIKQSSSHFLARAIHAVAAGGTFFSPSIARRIQAGRKAYHGSEFVKRATGLTAREMEVIQLIAEGAANKQIASELGISQSGVEKHRQHLMEKIGVHGTAGLTRYAVAHGIIESEAWVRIA